MKSIIFSVLAVISFNVFAGAGGPGQGVSNAVIVAGNVPATSAMVAESWLFVCPVGTTRAVILVSDVAPVAAPKVKVQVMTASYTGQSGIMTDSTDADGMFSDALSYTATGNAWYKALVYKTAGAAENYKLFIDCRNGANQSLPGLGVVQDGNI